MSAHVSNPSEHKDDVDKRTAVLWGREELLVDALERLLFYQSDWQVVRFSSDWDDATLLYELKRVVPDVLIVSESVLATDGDRLIQVVEECPRLKIITINLENNLISIYHKQTLSIKEASDLLEIVEAVDQNAQGGHAINSHALPARPLQLNS